MSASNGEDFLSLLMKKHLDYILDRPVKALNVDVPDSPDDPGIRTGSASGNGSHEKPPNAIRFSFTIRLKK